MFASPTLLQKAVEANRDVEQRVVIVDCMKDKLELLTTTVQYASAQTERLIGFCNCELQGIWLL